jgi:hypothetical protein
MSQETRKETQLGDQGPFFRNVGEQLPDCTASCTAKFGRFCTCHCCGRTLLLGSVY